MHWVKMRDANRLILRRNCVRDGWIPECSGVPFWSGRTGMDLKTVERSICWSEHMLESWPPTNNGENLWKVVERRAGLMRFWFFVAQFEVMFSIAMQVANKYQMIVDHKKDNKKHSFPSLKSWAILPWNDKRFGISNQTYNHSLDDWQDNTSFVETSLVARWAEVLIHFFISRNRVKNP